MGLDIFSGRHRRLNGLFAAAIAIAGVLFIRALWQPAYEEDNSSSPEVKTAARSAQASEPARADYDVISSKDLFRPGRQMYVAPPPPPPKLAPPPPPPPPKPVPRLALIGTVIRDDGQSAIMDYNGKSSYYKVGDDIEGFIIKSIRKDTVVLEREGEILRIGGGAAGASTPNWLNLPNSPATKTTPAGQRAPVVTPLPPAR